VTAGPPIVRLRPATMADADLVLGWANDPSTRAASFHPAAIERGDHLRWMASLVESPSTRFWIGEAAGRPVGQVRIDLLGRGVGHRVGEISISIAPEARGLGLGRALLAVAVAEAGEGLAIETLVARVRLDNPVSLGLFAQGGFEDRGHGLCFEIPCARFELRIQ
jgi:RimJ/RimL family protein N-acetyltransferase